MKKRIFFLFFFLIMALTSVKLFAQDVYYVQSVRAKVMSGPSFKAKVIGEASKGTRLAVSGREGNWIKVKFNVKDGYVSMLVVSAHPPIKTQGLIKGEQETEIKQSVRRRASTYTSAAAARGLAQDDRRRLSKNEKVDYESLEKVESFAISDGDLARFMEGSRL